MNFDVVKALLLGAEEEGADRAAIYDSVLTELSGVFSTLEESKRSIEDLTNRVAELTDNNLKLIEKIKYVDSEEVKEKESEPEIVTIDNLFEEE